MTIIARGMVAVARITIGAVVGVAAVLVIWFIATVVRVIHL